VGCDTDAMQFRGLNGEEELAALADLAAPIQASPATYVAYLAVERDGVLAELTEATWHDVAAIAERDVALNAGADAGPIAGWLIGDVDPEMGRVWWFGPFVDEASLDEAHDWEAVASGLLAACVAQLPAGVTEEEMAVDARSRQYREWASTHGFVEEEGSLALVLDGSHEPPSCALGAPGPPPSAVREIAAGDRAVVAALHDELFPGTHTTGANLVAGHDATHRRLVVEVDGAVAGYVAVERQPDGSGYIDFLGVAPAARRGGLGAALVRAGIEELRRLDSTSVHLTVRENNTAARGLYRSLGFREERLLVPLRRGFRID
jgi:ribosomal protein S18 acetylase RimI-like enzyme